MAQDVAGTYVVDCEHRCPLPSAEHEVRVVEIDGNLGHRGLERVGAGGQPGADRHNGHLSAEREGRLISSQIDTAPKLNDAINDAIGGLITSQIDTAPKPSATSHRRRSV